MSYKLDGTEEWLKLFQEGIEITYPINNAPQPSDPLPITDEGCGLQVGKMFVELPTINPNITLMLHATITDYGNAEEAYTALAAEVQRVYNLVKEAWE